MAKTRKPCPACHETDRTPREADSICGSCKQLLEDGRRFRRQSARKSGQAVRVPSEPAQYPHLSHVPWKLADQLHEAFHEIVVACSSESSADAWHHKAPTLLPPDRNAVRAPYTAYVFLEPATRDALRTLYQAIKAGLAQAFREGQQDGTRFVANLADGKVSLAELQDVQLRLDREPTADDDT